MIADLLKSLDAAGHPGHVHQLPDGSRLLVLPYGARMLGLFTAGSDESFFWANPALQRPTTARSVFAGSGWHNTGGDRTWLAPELDIFFPDYPDTRRHWEPPELDASEYLFSEDDGRIGLHRDMRLRLARPECEVEFMLGKWFEPAPNPLRHQRDLASLIAAVQYAGYTQQTGLYLTRWTADVRLGIWNLVQLPHGGELLIPTYRKETPRVLFGSIPADRLVAGDRLIRFRMDFPGEHKIAVRAAGLTGRAGYLHRTDDQWSLVIRNFFVQPSGEYVDVPKDDPQDFGYAFHAVNVLSPLGDFCELEYHAPALGSRPRDNSSVDVSEVWAYRGPADAIRDVARVLLGAEL